MVKHAAIALLLFAASLIHSSNCAYDKYCPTTPKTFETDYLKNCGIWMSSDTYCRQNAWPQFKASFAFKDPEKITERLAIIDT